MSPAACQVALMQMMDEVVERESLKDFVLWYYTPMALPFTSHLAPRAVVYDCLNELSAFRGAPSSLVELEGVLLERADLVTVGGQSLYHSKQRVRGDCHLFPSSVDVEHFSRARGRLANPTRPELCSAPPEAGFLRGTRRKVDVGLLADVARQRPQWQLVLLGPVVKIDPETLPRADNIHYLGAKRYTDLPHYIANWDVALLPFARNESTRFISPTKTPEYLAAGRPVVSTSIADVVEPYARG